MVRENEVIIFLIGLGCLFFLLSNRSKLTQITNWKIITTGFLFLLASWVITILEGFFWPEILNAAEHVCYAAGAITTAYWFWRVFAKNCDADA